jgi:hypothetical protein
MARDPELYEKLARSIAPSIYGDYTTNIKKAIACMLVGGSRKRLPDGMIVRWLRPSCVAICVCFANVTLSLVGSCEATSTCSC